MWIKVLDRKLKSKGPGKGGRTMLYLECSCGIKSWTSESDYKFGKSKRCWDCGHKEAAKKLSKDETYRKIKKCWDSMTHRCLKSNSKQYKYYGGRGITICKDWLNFNLFKKWALENGYELGLTIERKDVNGNYCPENCCFIEKKYQAINTRKTKWITFKGKTQHLSAWAREINILPSQISQRLIDGWTIEEAITIKPRLGSNQSLRKKA